MNFFQIKLSPFELIQSRISNTSCLAEFSTVLSIVPVPDKTALLTISPTHIHFLLLQVKESTDLTNLTSIAFPKKNSYFSRGLLISCWNWVFFRSKWILFLVTEYGDLLYVRNFTEVVVLKQVCLSSTLIQFADFLVLTGDQCDGEIYAVYYCCHHLPFDALFYNKIAKQSFGQTRGFKKPIKNLRLLLS